MSLIEFRPGELALSSEINSNFQYLDDKCTELAGDIMTKTSAFSSQVYNLNSTVENLLGFRECFVSTGMILPFVGSVIPDGYLICDGSTVLVEDFENLYDVIGTTYGSSDSTNFNLPDLRNKTVWGTGLNALGEYLVSKLPNITGQFRLAGTEGSSNVSGAFQSGAKGGYRGGGHDAEAWNPLIKFDASRSNDIYTEGYDHVQPPALVLNFIIKY